MAETSSPPRSRLKKLDTMFKVFGFIIITSVVYH